MAALELAVEVNADVDIKVTRIVLVGVHGHNALNLLALGHAEGVVEIEDGLAPVGGGDLGRGVQNDGLVAGGEGGVEVDGEGVELSVVGGDESVLRVEAKLIDGDLVDIEGEEGGRVGHDLGGVDGVDKGLNVREALEVGEVKALNILPDLELRVNVLLIGDAADEHVALIGEELDIGGAKLVASIEDGVEHGFIQQEVAHPLGDDDINLLVEGDLLHLTADDGDDILEAIVLNDLGGLLGNGGAVDANNLTGAGLGGEHGKDAGAAANVENNLILEKVAVGKDSVAVGAGALSILKHVHVDTVVAVGIKIVVAGDGGGGVVADLGVRLENSGHYGVSNCCFFFLLFSYLWGWCRLFTCC